MKKTTSSSRLKKRSALVATPRCRWLFRTTNASATKPREIQDHAGNVWRGPQTAICITGRLSLHRKFQDIAPQTRGKMCSCYDNMVRGDARSIRRDLSDIAREMGCSDQEAAQRLLPGATQSPRGWMLHEGFVPPLFRETALFIAQRAAGRFIDIVSFGADFSRRTNSLLMAIT